MFNLGDIVLQEKTLVNKKNYKDNKKNRLSVVLFNFIYNNKSYICTCPITNHQLKINNFSNKFLYIPYQILNDRKYCSIKLDSVNYYLSEEIKPTGLKLDINIMLKLYNKMLDLNINEFVFNLEECRILKENIIKTIESIKKEENKRIKEEKRLKKLKRKELKNNYNIKKD